MAEGANRTRSGLQGYVTHQSFKGMRMPATVQNLVMRDYITRKGAQIRLSVGEYFFDNCFVQLYSMLRKLDEIEGIVMCSLFMMPEDPGKRRWIYDRFLESGAALHFVFEDLVVDDEDGIRRAEQEEGGGKPGHRRPRPGPAQPPKSRAWAGRQSGGRSDFSRSLGG